MIEPDAAIRARAEAGDVDGAVTLAIDRYGDELLGFLTGLARDHDHAGDLFSATCERAWRSLPKFRWESPVRTWLYRIARNEFLRAAGRKRRKVPLSDAVSAVIARVRSTTPDHQRTAVKDRFAAVRAQLPPDDHMLLGLRIEQNMSWDQIAEVLETEPATLRKRFERLKDRLKAMADQLREP